MLRSIHSFGVSPGYGLVATLDPMDDAMIGRAFRAVRIRSRQRQADVATATGVSRETVIALERESLDRHRLADMRAVAASLGMWLDVTVRWHGADLDRLLNAGHAAMHESLAGMFSKLSPWTAVPEVSFSIFGERGVVDIAAWHESSRTLLLVEIKTALGDPQELVGTMDRRIRLGSQIAATRGWKPATIGAWVVFLDSRTNRRHVQRHERLLRSRFPSDGRAMRSWLRAPSGPIAALSFWSDVGASDLMHRAVTPRRVRPTNAERREHEAPAGRADESRQGVATLTDVARARP